MIIWILGILEIIRKMVEKYMIFVIGFFKDVEFYMVKGVVEVFFDI